ncbi:hypothetical protein AFL01nite_02400 [Aeromicrobium flavum]|uniref:Uncharacterized protein n=1 Tax=Aeromicrobium flavum TaxID=416568 RepID=A0A512HR34_9ACTN|nr:hypothetical protein [Aeromicrobium flavum]GEO87913.1 hypothetical protein AFL01nite_02400 [Aeromicrobium flavum]
MGLEEEIERAKAERAEAEAQKKAWNESGFWESSPKVGPPPGEWHGLIADSLHLLRFNEPAVVARAPDGTLRAKTPGKRTVTARTFLGGERRRTIADKANSTFAKVLIGSQGKDSDNYSIWIFQNGHVAIVKDSNDVGHSSFDRDRFFQQYSVGDVRAAIIETVSRY